MENLFDAINNNKFAWGVTMLLLNTGSRVVMADLPAAYDWVLTHVPAAKYAIVMSMFFVATHDALSSLCLTILYLLVVDGIMHQKTSVCVLPKEGKRGDAERSYEKNMRLLNRT